MSPRLMKQAIFLLWFFALFAFGIYDVWGGGKPSLTLFLLISSLALMYTIIIMVYGARSDHSLTQRFFMNGFVATSWTLLFALFALQMATDLSSFPFYIVYTIIGLLIIRILDFMTTYSYIKRDGFAKNQEIQPNNAGRYGAIGGVVGAYIIAPFLLSHAAQETSLLIGVLCFLLLAGIVSLGTMSFLQYYYAKRYAFTDENLGITSAKSPAVPAKHPSSAMQSPESNSEASASVSPVVPAPAKASGDQSNIPALFIEKTITAPLSAETSVLKTLTVERSRENLEASIATAQPILALYEKQATKAGFDLAVVAQGDNTILYTYTYKNQIDVVAAQADIKAKINKTIETLGQPILPKLYGRVIDPTAEVEYLNANGSTIATLTIHLAPQ